MIRNKPVFLIAVLLCLGLGTAFAQSGSGEFLREGVGFYSEGKFGEALRTLRRIPPSAENYPEALYWISLAEISAGNSRQALAELAALEKADPQGRWSDEIPYHRGRCYFYLGRHEEALVQFKLYVDGAGGSPVSRSDAAYYWMGESLLALGQLDSAADAFSVVVEKYPYSAKYEAASYRLDLINQKKIESELLAILKWTHEESLKTMEEYHLREKTYEQAIAAYQKRMAGLTKYGIEDLDRMNEYRDRLAAAEQQIAELEASLGEANAALEELRNREARQMDTEKAIRLLEIKDSAVKLGDTLGGRLEED